MKGSFLGDSPEGITDDSRYDCQALPTTSVELPRHSLFDDDCFRVACDMLRDRSKARIVDDISRLLVPSAETLTTFGPTQLKHLVVNINKRWTESIPATDTRPQPDFCIGFSFSAFTDSQVQNLKADSRSTMWRGADS